MIAVGIVGCGKVANQHATQICNLPESKLVAVCDQEPLMAGQMAERFGLTACYSDLTRMLEEVHPDVIHITTPPQSHYQIGRQCLKAGCHIYVEKPFTLDTREAIELIELAERNGLKVTAGHNAQFTHTMIRTREMVAKGALGGAPVHLESIYCYDFGDKSYASALLKDANHWIRQLPGSLLQNIISHGISRIAEFIDPVEPHIMAHCFTSRFLREIGQDDIIDEVRVMIHDRRDCTAYFTFSSQIKPSMHQFRLYGPRNSLIVDDDHQLVIKEKNSTFKSYLNFFVPPVTYAAQHLTNLAGNVQKFAKSEFHLPYDAGLKYLIGAFHDAIAHNSPLPLSYESILLTSTIMDKIFEAFPANMTPCPPVQNYAHSV